MLTTAIVFALQASCPSCADGAALIKRFELPEAATPIRSAKGWAPPKKIVTFGGPEWVAALKAVAPQAEIIGTTDVPSAFPHLADADVYIGICSPAVLRAGPKLRWIQSITAGVDLCTGAPELAGRELTVTNAQGVFGPQIADQTMGMLLTLTRRLNKYAEERRTQKFSHPPADPRVALDSGYWELEGKTMLVVGLGGIGTEVAKRAHAFGMRIIATRNSSRSGPSYVEYVGLSDEVVKLAARADVVVNALPLTPQTRGMFNLAFFQAMKPTAIYVNVGRGETAVTADLVQALQRRVIAGAALDVTDPEPLPDGHPIWQMQNVVLTPHSAGASDQVKHRLMVLAAENLRRYVAGERMISVADLRRGY